LHSRCAIFTVDIQL